MEQTYSVIMFACVGMNLHKSPPQIHLIMYQECTPKYSTLATQGGARLKRSRSYAIAALVALELLAGSASAGWVKTTNNLIPATPPTETDTCGDGEAFADAQSTGALATGYGIAEDLDWLCDLRVQNVATGVHIEAWTYTPGPDGAHGLASVDAAVSAQGVVVLSHGNAAASAVGYSLVASNAFEEVTAKLTQSAAETSSSLLGELSLEIEGFGSTISVPVTVSTGTGSYPDQDVDAAVGFVCKDFFWIKSRSRSQMELYANDSILPGLCGGNMFAKVTYTLTMGSCISDLPGGGDAGDATGAGGDGGGSSGGGCDCEDCDCEDCDCEDCDCDE